MADFTDLELTTERLLLTAPRESQFEAFAAMHANPDVMHDYSAVNTEAESHEKWDRYLRVWGSHGHGRWMVMNKVTGEFLGYVGIQPVDPNCPFAPALEIGWRMIRSAWGHGYATEAAKAAISDGTTRCRLTEVFSYTSTTNARSKAVMARLALQRIPELDFAWPHNQEAMLVWRLATDRSPSPSRKLASHLAKPRLPRED